MATRLAYNVEGEHGNLNMGMTHDLATAENQSARTIEYVFSFKVGGGEIEKVKVDITYIPNHQKCYLNSLSLTLDPAISRQAFSLTGPIQTAFGREGSLQGNSARSLR